MELDSRKKSKRNRMMRSKSFESKPNRMMHSKSFEMQEVRELGQKEVGGSRGFLILWMEIMEDVFQMEGKECQDQERLKM